MDRHSQFDVLPSYPRYSKREIVRNHNKSGDPNDSTYANIRKRLNTTVLSVPYEHKLDQFNVLGKKSHFGDETPSPKIFRGGEIDGRKPRSRVNSESDSHSHESHSPIKVVRTRDLGGSQMSDKALSTTSSTSTTKLPRVKKDRAPSETSTTSTVSRPFSFSRYDIDDSFWMQNIHEIEEIKERYAENSEFVASLHGFLEETTRKAKKKVAAMESPQLHHHKHSKSIKSSSRDSSINSKEIVERYNGHIDHEKHKHFESHDRHHLEPHTNHPQQHHPHHRNDSTQQNRGHGRVILPAIHRPEEDTISLASTLTQGSMSSNASTLKNHNHGKKHKKSKYRKVEFNLFPKNQRPVLLPALKNTFTSREDHSKTPRSILKNHGSLESIDSLSIHQTEEHGDLKEEKQNPERTNGNWERHIPRLLSPIPASATRRNPVVFKNASNFHFNCSKEFKAVMGDFEDE